MAERRYVLNFSEFWYEDDLPDDMTDEDYDEWFKYSTVDFVRKGPGVVRVPDSANEPHNVTGESK